MKLNPDKFHLILSHSDIKPTNVGNFTIENIKSEKLLGATFDFKTNLKSHLENLYSEASRRLHGLARINPYMDLHKKDF